MTNAKSNFARRQQARKRLPRAQQEDLAWAAHQRAERPEGGLERFLRLPNAQRPWMSGCPKAPGK